jgi:glutamate decarboxylase
MKKQWQARRAAAGLPSDRPNLVMSHVAQVCWQKVGGHEPRRDGSLL